MFIASLYELLEPKAVKVISINLRWSLNGPLKVLDPICSLKMLDWIKKNNGT